MNVELLDFKHGRDVVVDGKRVPMLEAWPEDGGKLLLVFDRRIGLSLTAANYEEVVHFVGVVMENVMNPVCGRTFNHMVEIGDVQTEEGSADDR